jgi:hypothetical protein
MKDSFILAFDILQTIKLKNMKKNFVFYASLVATFVFLAYSCNSVEPQEKKIVEVEEEKKEEVKTAEIDTKAETEAEMKQLEIDAMKMDNNSNSRSGAKNLSKSVNPDDDCALRCGSDAGTDKAAFSKCMRNCLADKAKEKDKEKEQLEKEKQMLKDYAQEEFKSCIKNAKNEEDKKKCRGDYMSDKEIYYNYGK